MSLPEEQRVDLLYGEQSLGGVVIIRGIFQGNSLSPLFVLCLIPLTVILGK